MTSKAKGAVIYLRTSTIDQSDGFSMATQEAKCRAYAEYNDLVVKDVYRDEGISGKTIEKRPGIQNALNSLKEGDTLIVYAMSRAARSVKDMIYILENIKRKGAHFASATEKIDTSSAMGLLLFHIFAAIAEFESMQIGERVSHGMQQRKEIYGTTNNKARYGYQYVTEKQDGKTSKVQLLPDPEEQKVIAKIKELRYRYDCRGKEMPFSRIATELQALGIPTRHNRKWSAQTVKNILIAEGVIKQDRLYVPADDVEE